MAAGGIHDLEERKKKRKKRKKKRFFVELNYNYD